MEPLRGPLVAINGDRLLQRIDELAQIGAIPDTNGSSRLAFTDADREGRDLVVTWMRDLGLHVTIDTVGNVIASTSENGAADAVMAGSHIDTVGTGGRYDGNLGVLAGLEVIEATFAAGIDLKRPLAVAFFSNEEGSRFPPDMMGSLAYVGGMSVEEIAEEKPESLIKTRIEAAVGMQAYQAREIAFALGLESKAINRCAQAILGAYKAFSTSDATMVEINPLVLTGDDHVLALDCKMSFDDNALYRNPELAELRDKSQEDPKETYAADRGLNYIPLDGDIGNIVNGAGLAMASMDMIKLAGGEPANFLDVGGGATPEKIVKAFKLISMDEKVKVILVNIFAGINRCDWVAEGIVQALEKIEIKVPIVIRLAGTNVEKGNKILKESKIKYIEANTLEDAANKAVKALGN